MYIIQIMLEAVLQELQVRPTLALTLEARRLRAML